MPIPNTALLGLCVSSVLTRRKLNNVRWLDLTDISVPEENTAPAHGTDDNGDPPCADGRKCYDCGGNHLIPEFPLPQQANSICNGGYGGDGRGIHGNIIGNYDRGGDRNGSSRNITWVRNDGNRKYMVDWKYVHPVDKNTAADISGTTW